MATFQSARCGRALLSACVLFPLATFRTGLLVAALLLGSTATAFAGYPTKNASYPGPWIDGYTFNGTTGLYACENDTGVGPVEACSVSYWTKGTDWFVKDGWVATSNCLTYDYLSVVPCYGATFGDSTAGAFRYTVVGQRCIYPGPPGYAVVDGGLTSTYGFNKPGWCLMYANFEQNTGCPKCDAKSASTQNPINTSVGNEYESFTDYRGSGSFPLSFTRSYNSILATEGASPGNAAESLGKGWTSNIGNHLFINPSAWPLVLCQQSVSPYRYYSCPRGDYAGTPGLEVTVWHADGGQALFTYTSSTIPDGTALSPEANATGQLFYMAILPVTGAGSGYRYLRDDGYSEYYDTTGRLVAVQNREGLQQVYTYDTVNNRLIITDSGGRTLTLAFDSSNRIKTMQDPTGRLYTYTYSTDGNNNLVSVTYPDSNNPNGVTVQYKYENGSYPNALTGIVDENGNRYATWGYDGNGRATSSYLGSSTLQANQYGVAYTLDAGGRITSALITEPSAHNQAPSQRTVNFDVSNLVAHMTSADKRCTQCGDNIQGYTYDANGFIASETDFDGNTTDYQHGATGLELSRTEGITTANPQGERTITTQWDNNLRQPTLITEPGRTTAYTYDTVGHVLTKTVTDTATNVARTTTYTYNSFGLLQSVTDPLGHVTSYGYDGQGDLSSIANALSQVAQITSYDAHGMPLTIVDPNNVVTTLTYDARLRLTSRTVAGAKTQFSYDAVGNLIQVTLPTGSYLSYSYDSAHRLTGISDSVGDGITYKLDALGNRYEEDTKDPSAALKKTLQRTYNSLNQLTSLIGGAGQTTIYTPDNDGNVIGISDPLHYATGQTFDALNRLQTVVDPESGNTTYNYDALDRVQDVTDPKGLNTHYVYDAFGDVTQLESPDTGTTTYSYDKAGNRLTKLDARGIQATYSYDALNRLTGISYPDASRNVSYTYDQGANGIGHLTGMTDTAGSTSYSYDDHGNVIQKVVTFAGLPNHPFTATYQYDTADNLTSMTYPSGMQVNYTRDTAERITAVTANGTNVASGITYEPFGPISGLTLGNGLTENRSYDLAYRLTGITTSGIQKLTLGYNADDDIVSIADGLNSGDSQTLGYDSLNRLTLAQGAYGNQSYGYDLDGNRLNLNGTGYSYDSASNHLLTAGSSAFQYAADGNLVSDGSHAYRYDANDRLTGFDSVRTAYLYNGLGQRSVKFPVVSDTAPPVVAITSPANGATVSGTVSVTANATDDVAVASVQFQLDGANLGAPVTAAPYTISWNTASAAPGTHALTAIATDTGGKSTTSATVTVADVAATANGGTLATSVDTAAGATLSATPSYAGQTLTFSIVAHPAHGSVTITNASTGTFTYTPAAGYVGSDSFTFNVTDGAGTVSNNATERVTVVDTAATANDGSLSTPAGSSVSGTLSASPAYAGQTLTFTITANPANGTVILSNPSTGAFTYTPAAGYIGSDHFTFTVTDSSGTASDVATESLTVIDVTPTANGGSVSTPVNMRVTGTLSATAAYSGQTFSFTVTTNPVHGSVVLSNASTGAFTYTPTPGYVGDDSFTFTATDGAGHVSNAASESIAITDVAATANNGSLTTTAGTSAGGTLSATTAYAGQILAYSLATNSAHGTVTLTDATTGAFTYTPALGYVGPDSFTFTATDSYGTASNTATERLTVTDVAATASNGNLSTTADKVVSGTLVATRAYGSQTLTFAVTVSPSHGTVTVTDAAAGAFTYAPAVGYVGSDSFSFATTDGYGTVSATATVSIAVTDVAATPNSGDLSTPAGVAAGGTLSATPAYAGQVLTYSMVVAPSHGAVAITNATTGAYTYTPATGYAGSDSFTFQATDAYGKASNIATENVTITDVAPTANSGSFVALKNASTSGNVSAATAYKGQILTFSIAGQPVHGTVALTDPSTGAFTFTPSMGYQGLDSFAFTVTDQWGTVSGIAVESIDVLNRGHYQK